MSNRTIKAPGVEIFEHDMSEYPAISEGTHVLLAGFAQKGEDYEPYRLTSRSSWLKFYGAPTNEAEEYFYTAANEVFDKGGYLHSVKIPYSNDIRGIYAAAKFRIEDCRPLLKRSEDGDVFVDDDGNPVEDPELGNRSDVARLMDQYAGLKKLGINSISKIAPEGQDFLSYDLVEEYEAGESRPSSNIIYIVDKTRAVYTRAVKVKDVQENRDSRACIGIVPVITTPANTAWFQRRSTGLTSDINELYQPVRSLKTITFPAGAASAAEYLPTKFTAEDLSIDIVQESGSYDRSLAEMAAMQAQSCLDNGNMVDGKFAPFVCNEVAVIVFKAFISTEDSKIDFEVVEQFTGSLDPNARNERGVSTYIGTLINNTSDYIYFFSNLAKPKTTLKSDHAFVAGSNSRFRDVDEELVDSDEVTQEFIDKKTGKVTRQITKSEEYEAAKTFGGYTARMLGFDDNDDYESFMQHVHGSLNSFYNQNDKTKIAVTDEIIYGGNLSYSDVIEDVGRDVPGKNGDETPRDAALLEPLNSDEMLTFFDKKKFVVSSKFITDKPSVVYKIGLNPADKLMQYGAMTFMVRSPLVKNVGGEFFRFDPYDPDAKVNYTPDEYEANFKVGRTGKKFNETMNEMVRSGKKVRARDVEVDDVFEDVKYATYDLPEDFSDEDLYQLSIFNSTDYLRSVNEFKKLVNLKACAASSFWTRPFNLDEDAGDFDVDIPVSESSDELQEMCDRMIRLLIVNSMEKTARYKVNLRKIKKARIALDRLDDAMATFVSTTTSEAPGNYTSKIYIRDLYNSLNNMGVLAGIDFVDEKAKSDSSAIAGITAPDALEAKIADLINPDTSKKEKAEATAKKAKKSTRDGEEEHTKLYQLGEYPLWYAKCRIYLRHQIFECYRDMFTFLTDTLDDCAMTADRYLQTQQSLDDSNIMLGFYPEMAEPIITYTEIAQSLNKLYDTFGDLNSTTIDVVVDAGLSNIAQFVKQVYDPSADDGEDIGGCYEPVKYANYYKFNKNTDLSYWKTIVFKLNTFCKSIRKDCMFCTEAPRHLVLTGNKPVVRKSKKDTSVDINILPYLTMITGFNTSYGAGYMNWYKTISDYTGDILWVPPSIVACGSYILTDRDYNWWDAPAGQKRGVVDMADVSFNPTNKQAGEIYDVAWNYAINYKGNYINGIIQEGQKTFQSYHSAFDRINVRRLFLRCERYVYFASRAFLYEPNTAYTRRRYVDTITPFFEDIKNRGGMYDYKIICDDTNNTPDTIDRNELRVKIGIQPVKTIEFILVDFVASRTGSDWSELATI